MIKHSWSCLVFDMSSKSNKEDNFEGRWNFLERNLQELSKLYHTVYPALVGSTSTKSAPQVIWLHFAWWLLAIVPTCSGFLFPFVCSSRWWLRKRFMHHVILRQREAPDDVLLNVFLVFCHVEKSYQKQIKDLSRSVFAYLSTLAFCCPDEHCELFVFVFSDWVLRLPPSPLEASSTGWKDCNPLDSLSISAPNWWRAVMVDGVGSGMLAEKRDKTEKFMQLDSL